MKELTEADIQTLVQEFFQSSLAAAKEKAIRVVPLTAEQHKAALDESKEDTALFKVTLGRSDYSKIEAVVEGFLASKEFSTATDSDNFRRLSHELMKTLVKFTETEAMILAGDYSFEDQYAPPP